MLSIEPNTILQEQKQMSQRHEELTESHSTRLGQSRQTCRSPLVFSHLCHVLRKATPNMGESSGSSLCVFMYEVVCGIRINVQEVGTKGVLVVETFCASIGSWLQG